MKQNRPDDIGYNFLSNFYFRKITNNSCSALRTAKVSTKLVTHRNYRPLPSDT